jgi:two-component system, cell cycle response regulator CpdR
MAHILVAETDTQIRKFIAGFLTDFGHDVTACGDGTEAVALLAVGRIEVLVTDLVLRSDEGSMLSRHCAARGIPTITLTGYEFHIDQAEQDRPPPLVEKPFRLDDLQCVIDAVAVAAGSTRAAA